MDLLSGKYGTYEKAEVRKFGSAEVRRETERLGDTSRVERETRMRGDEAMPSSLQVGGGGTVCH